MPGGLEAMRYYDPPRRTRWAPVVLAFFVGMWIGSVLARSLAGV